MRKVDSFIKECQRLGGIGNGACVYIHSICQLLNLFNPLVSLSRKALKDFTFSDGTFLPKGTMIVAAARPIHHDGAFYENARAFEPFRFADLHEEDGEDAKYQFTSMTTEYLPFGHGRRAWYGLSLSLYPTTLKIFIDYILAQDVSLLQTS